MAQSKSHETFDRPDDVVMAIIAPDNTASQRIAQKIGMRYEKESLRPSGEVKRVYALERTVA